MLHPETTLPVPPRAGPGLSQEAAGSGLGIGMSPPGGVWREQLQPSTPANSTGCRAGCGEEGKGPRSLERVRGFHGLHPDPFTAGTQGTIRLTGRQATASRRGLKPAGQPLAKALAELSGRASQGLQIQPFSCLANLMVPINFKTHTFPQAPASSAQCSRSRARWEHRQARRCGRWGQPASRTGRSRSAEGGWAAEP